MNNKKKDFNMKVLKKDNNTSSMGICCSHIDTGSSGTALMALEQA